MNNVDFAGLLCSRLCHDLLSPVGAFANGLELMADEQDPGMRQRCLELLEQSAVASATKLKFFRLAFGSAGGFGDMIPAAEVRDAIVGLAGPVKQIALNWMIADENLPKPVVKLLLNIAMILTDALVRGGKLDVGVERRESGIEVAVRAEGDRLILDEGIAAVLSDTAQLEDMSSRTAPAWLVRAVADAHGGRITLSRESATVVLVGAIIAPA